MCIIDMHPSLQHSLRRVIDGFCQKHSVIPHYNLPTTPADVIKAHLDVPDGAGRVNAGGSQPIEVRFIPIE